MKKVLLTLIATLFSFSMANAAEYTVGGGWTQSIFAAEGKEESYSETGTLAETTKEYGAFDPSMFVLFAEAGNEQAAIGFAYHDEFDTPKNVNEANGPAVTGSNTSEVSATFRNYIQLYGLVKLPFLGMYAKAGISQADVIINEKQRSGNTYPDTSIDGYLFGFGFQHLLDNGIGVRAELTGHSFDDTSVANSVAASGNNNIVTISNMIGATGTIAVVKSF